MCLSLSFPVTNHNKTTRTYHSSQSNSSVHHRHTIENKRKQWLDDFIIVNYCDQCVDESMSQWLVKESTTYRNAIFDFYSLHDTWHEQPQSNPYSRPIFIYNSTIAYHHHEIHSMMNACIICDCSFAWTSVKLRWKKNGLNINSKMASPHVSLTTSRSIMRWSKKKFLKRGPPCGRLKRPVSFTIAPVNSTPLKPFAWRLARAVISCVLSWTLTLPSWSWRSWSTLPPRTLPIA